LVKVSFLGVNSSSIYNNGLVYTNNFFILQSNLESIKIAVVFSLVGGEKDGNCGC